MTIEEVDKIINDLRQQIPSMQMQLHQAEGYKQALIDIEKEKEVDIEKEKEVDIEKEKDNASTNKDKH